METKKVTKSTLIRLQCLLASYFANGNLFNINSWWLYLYAITDKLRLENKQHGVNFRSAVSWLQLWLYFCFILYFYEADQPRYCFPTKYPFSAPASVETQLHLTRAKIRKYSTRRKDKKYSILFLVSWRICYREYIRTCLPDFSTKPKLIFSGFKT